jgi:hypothetical protein
MDWLDENSHALKHRILHWTIFVWQLRVMPFKATTRRNRSHAG